MPTRMSWRTVVCPSITVLVAMLVEDMLPGLRFPSVMSTDHPERLSHFTASD